MGASRKLKLPASICIEQNKSRIGLGMHWFVINNGDKQGLRKASVQAGARYGYKHESEKLTVAGFYNGKKASKSVYCGAAVISSLYDRGIFITPVSEDTVWLLVVSKGQPMVGYDRVIHLKDAFSEVLKIATLLKGFHLYTSREIASEYTGELETIIINPDDLFRPEHLKKELCIKPVAYIFLNAFPAVLALSGICAAVYAAYIGGLIPNPYEEQKQQQAIANKLAQEQRQEQQYTEFYNSAFHNGQLIPWLEQRLSTLDKVHLEKGGWNLKSFSCSKNSPTCDIKWGNLGYGTYESLTSAAKHIGKLNFVDTRSAKQKVELAEPKSSDRTKLNIIQVAEKISQLPTNEDFMIKHVSDLQIMGKVPGLVYKIDKPRTGPKGSFNQPAAQKGSWSLSGDGVQLLIDAAYRLDPNVFTGHSLSVGINYTPRSIETKWELRGDYVIKG